MSKHYTERFANKQIGDWFVGVDRILNQLNGADLLSRQSNSVSAFPPYNIKSINENKFIVEIAVAGFTSDEIDITLEDRKLLIKGSIPKESTVESYIVRGIAERDFTRSFILADEVKIDDVELSNGILSINLHRDIPEERKPRKIEITSKDWSAKEFLAESD